MQFDGSASAAANGALPLEYAWDFGDASTGTGQTPVHTYAAAGTYVVTLAVTDARGLASAPATGSAEIAEPPNTAPVAAAGGPYTGTAGTEVQFDGSGSADADGDLPLEYAWDFGDGSTGTGETPVHTYADAGTYVVTLTVTDARGLASAPAMIHVVVEESESVLVRDSFSRVTTNGWGTADIGGPWNTGSAASSLDFAVDDDRGGALIVAGDNSPRNAATSDGDGYGVNVAGLTSFSIDVQPDNPNRFYTVQVHARRDDRDKHGSNYYRYAVFASGNGTMELEIVRNVDATHEDVPGANADIAVVWTPGTKYWIRWECVGTDPTALRMRVWQDGTLEPADWDIDVADDEPLLTAGTTGFRTSGPNGGEQTTFPITFTFYTIEYIQK